MKVLLAALVAVVLVSPALAQKSTTDNPDLLVPACITDEEIIKNAPAGAKLVKKLTAEEVKSFLAKGEDRGRPRRRQHLSRAAKRGAWQFRFLHVQERLCQGFR